MKQTRSKPTLIGKDQNKPPVPTAETTAQVTELQSAQPELNA